MAARNRLITLILAISSVSTVSMAYEFDDLDECIGPLTPRNGPRDDLQMKGFLVLPRLQGEATHRILVHQADYGTYSNLVSLRGDPSTGKLRVQSNKEFLTPEGFVLGYSPDGRLVNSEVFLERPVGQTTPMLLDTQAGPNSDFVLGLHRPIALGPLTSISQNRLLRMEIWAPSISPSEKKKRGKKVQSPEKSGKLVLNQYGDFLRLPDGSWPLPLVPSRGKDGTPPWNAEYFPKTAAFLMDNGILAMLTVNAPKWQDVTRQTLRFYIKHERLGSWIQVKEVSPFQGDHLRENNGRGPYLSNLMSDSLGHAVLAVELNYKPLGHERSRQARNALVDYSHYADLGHGHYGRSFSRVRCFGLDPRVDSSAWPAVPGELPLSIEHLEVAPATRTAVVLSRESDGPYVHRWRVHVLDETNLKELHSWSLPLPGRRDLLHNWEHGSVDPSGRYFALYRNEANGDQFRFGVLDLETGEWAVPLKAIQSSSGEVGWGMVDGNPTGVWIRKGFDPDPSRSIQWVKIKASKVSKSQDSHNSK